MAAVAADRGDAMTGPIAPTRNWLVSPRFDAIFIANIAWPLLLLLQWSDDFGGRAGLKFWQVYFVTIPHRWITLAVVFLDRERWRQSRFAFLGWLLVIVVLCGSVQWITGGLTCLLAIDYIWNAWHFAAQHQGIYRIYGRLTEPFTGWQATLEKWMLRLFLLYVTLRVAVATWSENGWQPAFEIADWSFTLIPIAFLARDVVCYRSVATGRIIYLQSVSMLYLCLLWSVHMRRPALVLSLTTASALFHALEYLAIVSWKMRSRQASQQVDMGWLGGIASKWFLALQGFLVVLGASAWMLDHHWKKQWLFMNVIVAFLHYTYDGLIWRRPFLPRSFVARGEEKHSGLTMVHMSACDSGQMIISSASST